MQTNREDRYADLLSLPHPEPRGRARMSRQERATQFSPFAALTGFEEAIRETVRQPGERIVLDEASAAALDRKLRLLRELLAGGVPLPLLSVTWFLPDKTKKGGEYVTEEGRVKRLAELPGRLIFEDGREIPFQEILGIDGEIFKKLENETE